MDVSICNSRGGHTIRGKIRLAYFSFAAIIGVISLLALLDLRYLDQHIEEGAVIASLKEHGLEIRRHEKNFFLYSDEQTRQEALRRVDETRQLLQQKRDELGSVLSEVERLQLSEALARYASLLSSVTREGHSEAESAAVREAGHAISTTLEELALRERAILRSSMVRSQRALLVSIAAVMILAAVVGWLLSRAVVAPLRQLELQLETIAEGKFNAVSITTRDQELISFAQAINRMLAELEARRHQLLHSEKLASLGVLVSGVAHELNNPLSNISTSTQLLQEELDSAARSQQREWLRQIEEQIERARTIVGSLLEFSRDSPFERRPVEVRQMIEHSLAFLHNESKQRLNVQLDIAPHHYIAGDEQRLQQVFINLMNNAADAAEYQTTLTISSHRLEEGQEVIPPHAYLFGNVHCLKQPRSAMLVISVLDDGPGITRETLPKIFDPFFTTKTIGKGVGLGLYVVKEIIDEHKGCIAVESEPGQGTRFTLVLPASEAGERS